MKAKSLNTFIMYVSNLPLVFLSTYLKGKLCSPKRISLFVICNIILVYLCPWTMNAVQVNFFVIFGNLRVHFLVLVALRLVLVGSELLSPGGRHFCKLQRALVSAQKLGERGNEHVHFLPYFFLHHPNVSVTFSVWDWDIF